jgi:hypothetical protein
MFLWLIALLYVSRFVCSRSLPVRKSTTNQVHFCRDDYVIIRSDADDILSHAHSSVTVLQGKKVSRTELFWFEAHDLRNVQWVIRTWDGGHLAVDEDGYFTGKVSTIGHI